MALHIIFSIKAHHDNALLNIQKVQRNDPPIADAGDRRLTRPGCDCAAIARAIGFDLRRGVSRSILIQLAPASATIIFPADRGAYPAITIERGFCWADNIVGHFDAYERAAATDAFGIDVSLVLAVPAFLSAPTRLPVAAPPTRLARPEVNPPEAASGSAVRVSGHPTSRSNLPAGGWRSADRDTARCPAPAARLAS
jgi:hypothetical protein